MPALALRPGCGKATASRTASSPMLFTRALSQSSDTIRPSPRSGHSATFSATLAFHTVRDGQASAAALGDEDLSHVRELADELPHGIGPELEPRERLVLGLAGQPAAIRVAPRIDVGVLRRERNEAREAQRSGELVAIRGGVARVHGDDRARPHEQPHDRLVDLAPEPGGAEPQVGERAELGQLELEPRVVVPGVLGREVGIAADESLVRVEQLVEGRHAIGAPRLRARAQPAPAARSRARRSAAARCRSRRPNRSARHPRAGCARRTGAAWARPARRRSRAPARGSRARAASPARRPPARARRASWSNGVKRQVSAARAPSVSRRARDSIGSRNGASGIGSEKRVLS